MSFWGENIFKTILLQLKSSFNIPAISQFTYPDYSWSVFGILLEFKHNVCHHYESVSPPHDKPGQVQDGAHVTRQNQVNKSKHGLETLDIVIQQVSTGN